MTEMGKKEIPSSLVGAGWANFGSTPTNTQMATKDSSSTTKNNATAPAPDEVVAEASCPDAAHGGDGKKAGGRISSGGKAPRKALSSASRKATSDGEPRVVKKRGPPRPHRRLEADVLHGRIEKLQKRIDKAKGVLEEAERHIDVYNKEKKYRAAEAPMDA